jgi:uncharacterized membrane protein
MRLGHVQLIVVCSGALLIVGGLSLIIAQFWLEASLAADGPQFPSRSANVEAGGIAASVQTTYVGLVVLVVGAVLEVVGFLATRPWRPAEPSGTRPPVASDPV